MGDALESLKRQLEIHRRNLSKLEERAALHGPLNVPLELQNAIELEEKEIARLEEEIARLEKDKNAAKLLREAKQELQQEREQIPALYRFLKVLRDPVFQGIGAIVAVLALVVAIGTWFWPDIRHLLFPVMPTAMPTSTYTLAPTIKRPSTSMSIGEVLIKVDTAIDTGGGRCREIVCNSQHRIEVTVLDLEGTTLQPGIFSYRFILKS